MFGLSFWELALVMLVALIAIGPQKLPHAMRSLGRVLRDLRRASNDIRQVIEDPLEEIREPLHQIGDELRDTLQQAKEQVEHHATVQPDQPSEREALPESQAVPLPDASAKPDGGR